MPYRPLLTGAIIWKSAPQLGYLGLQKSGKPDVHSSLVRSTKLRLLETMSAPTSVVRRYSPGEGI